MIEVFRTDIQNHRHALLILEALHDAFPDYQANVDLTDCDRILRIVHNGYVEAEPVIELLRRYDCHAMILEDELPEAIHLPI